MKVRRFLTNALVFSVLKVGVDAIFTALFHEEQLHAWLLQAAIWGIVMAAVFAAFPNLFKAKSATRSSPLS
jgi:hypothetical protein